MHPRPTSFVPVLLALLCFVPPSLAAQLTATTIAKFTPAEIERALPKEHPSSYYLYASRLWNEGKSDDAVFWFYGGQLRFRFHLRANPKLPPDGDPALFASFQAVLGEPINLYVGGDPKKWIAQIDRVLAWDEKTANGFTSKKSHAAELAEIRTGLVKLRDHIATNQDSIRAKREEEGIGAIGVVDGIYVEERKRKMPGDWPALAPQTTLAGINGYYEGTFVTMLGSTFFRGEKEVMRATAFRFAAVPPDSFQVIALRENAELASRLVQVRELAGALAFDEVRHGSAAGLRTGEEQLTVLLRTNADGDLVLQRHSVIAGTYPNKDRPVRLDYTFWNRAKRLPPPASAPSVKP